MGRKKERRRPLLWLLCGLLGLALMAGSVGLALYNLRTDMEAGVTTREILEEIAARPAASGTDSGANPGAASEDTRVQELYEAYVTEEEKPLPLVEIDGNRYVGVLTVPTLNLQLPVLAEWSYPNLRISPCRYYGSLADENMVVIAHNYRTHFGNIKNLRIGDEILFANMDGAVFTYAVSATEIVSPYATADVTSGDWPLTLCTCTIGGRSRVVVRCDRV